MSAPGIAAIGVKSAWLKSFHETVGNLVLISAIFLTGFGLIIVVGMVYNTARVAFHERGWELASLRVLGFTEAEVSRILLAELCLAVTLAMPLGVALSQLFVDLIVATHSSESFEIPAVVRPSTFATAILIVLGAAAASALVVKRQVGRLGLVAALKVRD